MNASERPPVFIGDELTAAGYRLTGVRVECPAIEHVAAALVRARAEAELVLITAGYAARAPARLLESTPEVLIAIVADAHGHGDDAVALRLRKELGLGS